MTLMELEKWKEGVGKWKDLGTVEARKLEDGRGSWEQ